MDRNSVETGPKANGGPDRSDAVVYDASNFLLRHARFIIGTALLVCVLALGFALLTQRSFQAVSAFTPESRETGSMLSTLASDFGLMLPTMETGESVEFYQRLLSSRSLLLSAGLTEYRFPADIESSDTLSGTLLDLYEIEEDTYHESIQELVDRLAEDVAVHSQVRANVVMLSTSAPWPALAEQFNRRLLDLVSEFNLEKRQSKAAAERLFIEDRIDSARAELREAEAALKQFREENRQVEGSPQLELEYMRLQREVDFEQQVFTALAQQYEEARIEEVRTAPVFTIIDPPEGSSRREGSLLTRGLIGLILGGVLGIGLAVFREYIVGLRRKYPDKHSEFTSLARSALSGLIPFSGRRRDGAFAADSQPARSEGSPGAARSTGATGAGAAGAGDDPGVREAPTGTAGSSDEQHRPAGAASPGRSQPERP